jgi:hypothetical protein
MLRRSYTPVISAESKQRESAAMHQIRPGSASIGLVHDAESQRNPDHHAHWSTHAANDFDTSQRVALARACVSNPLLN